jgi:hypothetical protein
MRKDMSKLLTERPRRGSSDGYDKRRAELKSIPLDEDSPFKESNFVHKKNWSGKEFNVNFNPLKRFLKSNVGRLWNDVYSEISRTFDKRKTVNYRIFEHLHSMVVRTTFIGTDGKVWYNCTFRGEEPIEKSYQPFFVDPKGFLRENKNYRRKFVYKKRDTSDFLQWNIPNESGYVKLNNVWYFCTFVPRKSVGISGFRWEEDRVGDQIKEEHGVFPWKGNIRCVKGKQMSSKEIKRLIKPAAKG